MRKGRIQMIVMFLVVILFAPKVIAQQWGLYTLYATKSGTQAFLVDTADSPASFHTWTFGSTKKSAYSAYLIPGDTLVRSYSYTASGGMSGGGVTGAVQKVTWNGTVAWDYQYNSATYTLHHDICPMPNGNVLMIAYELKTITEATQAGASTSVSIKSEKLIEVQPTGPTTGTVVWEWHLWDHLCQNYSSTKDNYVTSIIDNPQLLNINYLNATNNDKSDRWHMNGVDYNPALDQIVVSMHFMNSVFVIDHSTTTAQAAGHTGGNSGKGGDFLYRWGNPASYGATGTAAFNVIHDAHWISSDNPNYPSYLCGYNNKGGTGGKTAITVWSPPYSGNNYTQPVSSAYAPTAYTYQFNSSFSASNEGNSQQLPNGNMLVNNAFGAVYEINSAGTQLWTKASTSSSHAYRYSKCYVRAPIATATASATQVTSGTPVTLSASAVSVTETSPTYTYAWTSTAGFASTEQNPSISPTTSASYTVIITNTAIGCSDTATLIVNVGTSTLAATTTATPSAVCPGTSVQLNCTPSGGTTYTYQWASSPAGFTSTQQNPTVIPTAGTTYLVTVTSGTYTATSSTAVTLNSAPTTPTISQNGLVLNSSASNGNQWYYNGSIISGQTGNSYTPTQDGSYQVMVTDMNGCTAISSTFGYSVGISENNPSNSSIKIYPNPTQSSIQLEVPSTIENYTTQIMDICGKTIFVNENQSTIDLSSLNNGIYFIEIRVNGKSVQRNKIILNK